MYKLIFKLHEYGVINSYTHYKIQRGGFLLNINVRVYLISLFNSLYKPTDLKDIIKDTITVMIDSYLTNLLDILFDELEDSIGTF